MKSSVVILFCALVAVCECQIGGDGGVKQELSNGLSKVEITADPFQQVMFPILRNVYSKLNKYVNGIPVTITGPFIQNHNQYGDIKSQFDPLDAPRLKCGKQTCPRTWFVCESGPCQYPSEFDEIVVRCRSSLQNAEEQFQSIAELLFTVSSKMVRDRAFIKIPDAKSVYESTRPILEEVTENIESLEPFLSHEVIGQIAQDVLIDMEALQTVLNIFLQRLIEVDLGEQIKIPVSVYDRCFRPKDWIPQCSGRWPCTRIFLFSTRYAYAQQRPGCSCQRPGYQYGSRMIQPLKEFSFQLQPTQIFRQTLPLQILTPPLHQQPLPQSQVQANVQSSQLLVVSPSQQQQLSHPHLFTPSQVYTQPQYQTIQYQPSVSLSSEQGSSQSNGILGSTVSKNQMQSGSNIHQVFTQTNPQQIIVPPQYQVIRNYHAVYAPETRSHFDKLLTQPVITANSNALPSIIYSQPKYQAVEPYGPVIYRSGGDISEEATALNDGNYSTQLSFTQLPPNPKFLPAQMFPSLQYHTIKQYRPAMYAPESSQDEFSQSLINQDNSTSSQQSEAQQLGFEQAQHQFFTQPPYIEYKPAKFASGARSLLENSTDHNGKFAEPQQQRSPSFQYQTPKQNQQAMHNNFSHSDNSTGSTTQEIH